MQQHIRCLWEEYFLLWASRRFVLIKDENVFALSQQWSTGTLCIKLRRTIGVIFQRKRLVIWALDLCLLGRSSGEKAASDVIPSSECEQTHWTLLQKLHRLFWVKKKKKREPKHGHCAFNCRYLSLQTFIHLLYLEQ